MKGWMSLLSIAVVISGVLAFSGAIQAATGALKAVFWVAISLLALCAAGFFLIKKKTAV